MAPILPGTLAGFARLLSLFALAPAAVAQVFPGPPTSSPGPPGSLAPQSAACVRPLACFTVDDAPPMQAGTMQVVGFYDGSPGTTAVLDIEMIDAASGACCNVRITMPQGTRVYAHEFRMLPGWEPTGRSFVGGVVPNGGIDGVAFSIYVRDHSGDRWLLQSCDDGLAATTPNFMGAWPVAWAESQWDAALSLNGPCFTGPGVLETRRRRQAHGALTGAQLLPNGQHFTPRNPTVLGDLNGDRCVDGTDVDIFLSNPGIKCSSSIGKCSFGAVMPFTSDRFSALPPDRMQLFTFYDAAVITAPVLTIECRNPTTLQCCDLEVTLPPWLLAFEFAMNGFEPTGRVTVVNNASGGRLGFAMYGRETAAMGGDRWMMSSSDAGLGAAGGRQFFGIPPYEQSQAQWDNWLSFNGAPFWPPATFDDFVLRRQAQAATSGAQLLPDGVYMIPNRRCIDADLNGDGMIDASDLNVLIANFGVGCCQ